MFGNTPTWLVRSSGWRSHSRRAAQTTHDEGSGSSACRLPNFLMIGAAKSGSSFLWSQMLQHPDVFMHPHKQLNFFSNDCGGVPFKGVAPQDRRLRRVASLKEYRREFRCATNERVVGEASNTYLYSV